MKKAHAIFVMFAIILGLLFLIYAVSQFDIDLGKKLAKWQAQREAVMQEWPSVKISEED